MSMRPQDIIRKKRDGGELSREEVASFVGGVVDGAWADYQASALLMAVYLNGMTTVEMEALTQAMLGSGEVLDFSDVALAEGRQALDGRRRRQDFARLAPLVAACGVRGADDFGTRTRTHGRHARQARSHPRLPRPSRPLRVQKNSRPRRLRDDGADRRDSARRQAALRAARRDRDGRVHPAHRRLASCRRSSRMASTRSCST